VLAVALASPFALVASRPAPRDTDLFWHLATGRWVAEHGALATVDTFSSTAAGAAVPQHQWLGQLLLYVSYAGGSWWGVVALRTIVVVALVAIVLHLGLKRATHPAIGVVVSIPAILLSGGLWTDRPELFGLLAFAAFLWLALAAREGHRGALVVLVPLFAVWANLHGSFIVGVVLLAALALEVALFDRLRRRAFALATFAALAATLANPTGLGVYDSPGWHFASPPRLIPEWGLPDVTSLPGLLFALTLLGTFGLALLQRGDGTHYVALLVPLAFLALSAVRHTPLYAIASVPYLATILDRSSPLRAGTALRVPSAVPAAVAAMLLVASLATAPRTTDLTGYPVGALSALRAQEGPLFNDYDWGGYLIWAAPEHPVFIDGRLRPYVGTVLDDYREAMGVHPRWRDVLERHGVALVLVRPEASLAVRLREAGWSSLHADVDATLLRRP
jgi:hypothetical protein